MINSKKLSKLANKVFEKLEFEIFDLFYYLKKLELELFDLFYYLKNSNWTFLSISQMLSYMVVGKTICRHRLGQGVKRDFLI